MSVTTRIKKTVRTRADINAEVESRCGDRGYSAYVNRALLAQLELDRLGELAQGWEEEFGPVPQDVMRLVSEDIDAADAASDYRPSPSTSATCAA